MEKDNFAIEGMVCASCAQTVEKLWRNCQMSVMLPSIWRPRACKLNMDLRSVCKRSCRQSKMRVMQRLYPTLLIKLNLKLSKLRLKRVCCIKAPNDRRFDLCGCVAFSCDGTNDGSSISALLDGMHAPKSASLIQLALVLPVLWFGKDYLTTGAKALFARHPNMDSLVLVGSGAALLYSLVNTYLAVVTEQHHDLYYEAAGTIIALVMLGKYFEDLSKQKTNFALTSL